MGHPITHGMSYERIYMVWVSMKVRCENSNHPSYKRYGARGIKVCERWNSFENFYKDMGKPQKGFSLDRIDNNGDYEPSNCRWATRKQQGNNRSGNIILIHNGISMTMTEWGEKLRIGKQTLYTRLVKYKWPVEKALLTPVRFKNKNGLGRFKK